MWWVEHKRELSPRRFSPLLERAREAKAQTARGSPEQQRNGFLAGRLAAYYEPCIDTPEKPVFQRIDRSG